MVKQVTGSKALPGEVLRQIVAKTDGVPLFVEELTKAVLESAEQGDRVAAVLATTSLAALSVPATLHASLMARLDRLGPAAKELAQIGAVLGRDQPVQGGAQLGLGQWCNRREERVGKLPPNTGGDLRHLLDPWHPVQPRHQRGMQ